MYPGRGNPARLTVDLIALEQKNLKMKVKVSGKTRISRNDAEAWESGDYQTVLPELSVAKMLRCQMRYFTDGAVIYSREFVNGAFVSARERLSERGKDGARRMRGSAKARDRFSERRKDGARRLRGTGKAAAGKLWSMRDLRVGIE